MSIRLSAAHKKWAELETFVAPHLRPDEDIVTGIAIAVGSLQPLTPPTSVFAWIGALPLRARAWGLVVTTERVVLVRRSPIQPGRPREIALDAPIAAVAVIGWKRGAGSGLMRLKIGEQTLRLNVVDRSIDDVPAVLSALAHDAERAPGAGSVDPFPIAPPLTAIRDVDSSPGPTMAPGVPVSTSGASTPLPSAEAVRVSPVFVAIFLASVSLGALLWSAPALNRFLIFAFVVCGWIVSLCLHEFGHAYAAYRGGDHSVAERGYLTLNPFRYSHPVTSIALPLVFLVLGGIGLPGGAVYIDKTALRTRRSASLVAAAGPLTNLALAFMLFAPFHFVGPALAHHPHFQHACAALAVLELVAAFLNLLPIPPLDGFGIIEPLFTGPGQPRRAANPAAFLLLLFLLFTSGAGATLWHSAYRVGYAMGVPHGVAGDGLQLARFWTKAPPPRSPYAYAPARKQSFPFPMKSSPTPPESPFPKVEVTPGPA